MENPVSRQLFQACAALLAGVALGFVYEGFRALRYGHGFLWQSVCDALFALIAAMGLFVLGMGPGGGDLRIFMVLSALGGAGLYARVFGRPVRRAARALHTHVHRRLDPVCAGAWRVVCRSTHIFFEKGKKTFSNGVKWFTLMFGFPRVRAAWRRHKKHSPDAAVPRHPELYHTRGHSQPNN